jgi:hypothetical protein
MIYGHILPSWSSHSEDGRYLETPSNDLRLPPGVTREAVVEALKVITTMARDKIRRSDHIDRFHFENDIEESDHFRLQHFPGFDNLNYPWKKVEEIVPKKTRLTHVFEMGSAGTDDL